MIVHIGAAMRTARMPVMSCCAMASHVMAVSHAIMQVREIGRCRRTETGCANCTRESVSALNTTQIARLIHGLECKRYRVGMIMFHSAGKPLNHPSSVSWSVRDIHRALTNRIVNPVGPTVLSGRMSNLYRNATGTTVHVK